MCDAYNDGSRSYQLAMVSGGDDTSDGAGGPTSTMTGPPSNVIEPPSNTSGPTDDILSEYGVPTTRAADNDKENTQPTGSSGGSSEETEEAEPDGASANPPEEKSPGDDGGGSKEDGGEEPKPRKNRCAVCRKKVGLTGFLCRCGGLYCAVHRYSDKHDCTFDYRELGAREIRRNNPVVVGEKIQKI